MLLFAAIHPTSHNYALSRRIPLPPRPPVNTSISSFRRHRLFSSSLPLAEVISEDSTIKSPFSVEYLVKSCGLSIETAIKASKRIPHLKSPENPDYVLQFLRDSGLTNADIRKIVTHESAILCWNLENTIKPRMEEIREIGFSPPLVRQLVVLSPVLLRSKYYSLRRKIEFWTYFFGSLEGILNALKKSQYLLSVSIEKVVEPNISFLEKHCGVSPCQIRMMIMRSPALFSINPNKFKEAAQRAENLGIPLGGGSFIYALQITLCTSPTHLDAKIKNLKKLGFSKTQIDSMIKKMPLLLTSSDETMSSKIGFLTTEAGFDLLTIALHPMLFNLSLERRLIPRHYVLQSLKSKGLCQKWSFSSAMLLTEVRFEDLFVRRYRDIIPEVFEAYEAALAAKTKRQTLDARDNLSEIVKQHADMASDVLVK